MKNEDLARAVKALRDVVRGVKIPVMERAEVFKVRQTLHEKLKKVQEVANSIVEDYGGEGGKLTNDQKRLEGETKAQMEKRLEGFDQFQELMEQEVEDVPKALPASIFEGMDLTDHIETLWELELLEMPSGDSGKKKKKAKKGKA